MSEPAAIEPRAFLRALFDEALAAADPARVVPPHLPEPPAGRTVVVGAGKASAAMASALEQSWPGPLEGLVVTRTGHAVPCTRIEIVEASHPVPDEAGRQAAGRILELARGCGEDDLVIALVSGGGSALLALPAEGITLEEKQDINRALLASGARIDEMNCLRKHLSAIKGGRLAAAAHPARVVALLISDVPGDDPSVIASGPTVGDPSTREDALEIIDKYAIDASAGVLDLLRREACETPKPGDPRLARAETRLIARPQDSLEAAARLAAEHGVTPLILGDAIEGEAREVAIVMAGIARQAVRHGQPAAPPCVLLSGGETTVTLRAKGRGGRNSEFLLSLAIALDGLAGVHAIACDTDGIDGSEDNAGAIIGPDSLTRAARLGLSAKAKLGGNDAYGFFADLGDLVVSGPTLTNVNDFRAILIEKRL
jgi:hydroxypyruvate reductase